MVIVQAHAISEYLKISSLDWTGIELELHRLGYDKWKDNVGYGQRWMAEAAFSSFERTFGEHVKATKFEHGQ